MKVVKRDGSIVEYDSNKISSAIEKANIDVLEDKRIHRKDIQKIINYIEKLGKKRMLVEDIQDIIEVKLMEFGKYDLAKKYIVYRYNRALVRKQNTTDESILTMIKSKNHDVSLGDKDVSNVLAQRELIAKEVSKDLTKRILLPEKINKAHEEGILYFHDMEYFLHPVFNSSSIDIQDMLDNGTVINGKQIEPPKSFLTACMILTQILMVVAGGQSGGVSVDIKYLGKYVDISRQKWKERLKEVCNENLDDIRLEKLVNFHLQKEITSGIQTIQYQINAMMMPDGKKLIVTFLLHIDDTYPYNEEVIKIIKEILTQRKQGMKNQDGEYISPSFPKLIYVLDENNNLTGGKYDEITRLAVETSKLRGSPNYLSAIKMIEQYDGVFSPIDDNLFLIPRKTQNGNFRWKGRFNQGVVTLNLAQIGLLCPKEEEFMSLLEKRLELCFDALMRKHYSLLGTEATISPIHWCYGAIARLKEEDKIDALLKGEYSNLVLGYSGLYEATYLVTGEAPNKKEGKSFFLKVLKKMNQTLDRWKEETNISFSLALTSDKKIGSYFLKRDLEQFGYIEKVTDKYYYFINFLENDDMESDLFEKLEIEEIVEKYSKGGYITYLKEKNITEEMISYISKHQRYISFDIEGKR